MYAVFDLEAKRIRLIRLRDVQVNRNWSLIPRMIY